MLKTLKEIFFIGAGCLLLALAINLFFLPNTLVTGGFTGLSIIVTIYMESLFGISVPIWFLNILFNVPLFILTFKLLGKGYVLKSLYATLMLSFCLFLTEGIPLFETELIMASIFGGVISGFGLGIIFRGYATTGGTDLVAMLLSKLVLKHINVSKLLFIIDTSILLIGLFAFGPEISMYAILAVYVTTKSIDGVLEGVGFSKVVYVITTEHKKISDVIIKDLNRGVTGLVSKGMYSERDKLTLMTVISKKEVVKLKELTKKIDKNAFIIVADVKEVLGEGFMELK